MPPTPSHLTPSELGTKEYWESTYTADLTTHATNPAHTGTTWFSDSAAEEKVLQFLEELSESRDESHPPTPPLDRKTTTFLDLGTGNGSMLFALREEGWAGEMVGVDYSAKSVELAREVGRTLGYASKQGGESKSGQSTDPDPDAEVADQQAPPDETQATPENGKEIRFELWDIMTTAPPSSSPSSWFPLAGFDIILDKGTFDAISLSSERDGRGRRICEGYRERVERLVRRGGLMLVTSCNWTEEELRGWFVGDGELEVVGRVRYPVFRFGGGEGQSVSSVCFRRRG